MVRIRFTFKTGCDSGTNSLSYFCRPSLIVASRVPIPRGTDNMNIHLISRSDRVFSTFICLELACGWNLSLTIWVEFLSTCQAHGLTCHGILCGVVCGIVDTPSIYHL
jgi:hypothetical protein